MYRIRIMTPTFQAEDQRCGVRSLNEIRLVLETTAGGGYTSVRSIGARSGDEIDPWAYAWLLERVYILADTPSIMFCFPILLGTLFFQHISSCS